MVKLDILSSALEKKLNDMAEATLKDDTPILDTFAANTHFKFRIFPIAGEYEKAIVEGNEVTYFINGVVRRTGTEKDGTSINNYVAEISTMLDLVVPMCELFITEDDDTDYTIYQAVTDIIDMALTYNFTETIYDDDDGTPYFVSSRYEMSTAGIRNIRGQVGDSLPLSVAIDYAIVAMGVNSGDVIFEVEIAPGNYVQIYPKTFGLARSTLQESSISSDSEYGISKNTNGGSAFVVGFSRDVKRTEFDYMAARYVLTGDNPPFYIKITYPDIVEPFFFKVTFSEAGINGLDGAAMSSDYKLTEVI